jgi:hypothetical protein
MSLAVRSVEDADTDADVVIDAFQLALNDELRRTRATGRAA